MKGTDIIVKYLKEHASVSHVFTYAGGTSAWLLDAIAMAQNISVLPMRHANRTPHSPQMDMRVHQAV